MDLIGARVDVGEIKRIERDEGREGEMILVKLGNGTKEGANGEEI